LSTCFGGITVVEGFDPVHALQTQLLSAGNAYQCHADDAILLFLELSLVQRHSLGMSQN
jgi:hypothetical protein